MSFTTNLSGTAQVDDSVIALMDQQFIVASGQDMVMDQFVTYKKDIGAASIKMPKYSRLALATTALTETDDVTSEAMADAGITFTPAEYGKAVTTTKLANLQTGGKADLAAARLAGINMGASLDKLAIMALEASTNNLYCGQTSQGAITASNVMTAAFLDKLYNKLSRASVPKLAEGNYIAVVHEDVAVDLRADSAWFDIAKYANPQGVLKNEIGTCKGFRIVIDNNITIGTDLGATNADVYKTLCFGFNALGKAVSQEAGGVITGPFDKLNRFVNIGWHGVLKYGIVDQDALWVGQTASSVGSNGAG